MASTGSGKVLVPRLRESQREQEAISRNLGSKTLPGPVSPLSLTIACDIRIDCNRAGGVTAAFTHLRVHPPFQCLWKVTSLSLSVTPFGVRETDLTAAEGKLS